jgi:glutamine amidotransferase
LIIILDYGICDFVELTSVLSNLNERFIITSTEAEILKADKLILPNTSDLKKAVKQLHRLNLFSMLRMLNKPTLGIANGMKLMCEFAKEENAACLGFFPLITNSPYEPVSIDLKSTLKKVDVLNNNSSLLNGIASSTEFYFDRCYELPVSEFSTSVLLDHKTCTTSLEKDNFFAVQFIPEKSYEQGIKVLKNFIEI